MSQSQKKHLFSLPPLSHIPITALWEEVFVLCPFPPHPPPPLFIEQAPDHLVDHPATDTPVCP